MLAIDAQHDVATATAALHDSAIGKVEIVCLTPSMQPNVSLNAERLGRYANRHIEIRDIAGDRMETSLISAVEKLKVKQGEYDPDLHFGIKFYNRSSGNPLTSIYLDRWGKLGTVNGVTVAISPELLKWAKTNIAICF